jgi:hypothetical protein
MRWFLERAGTTQSEKGRERQRKYEGHCGICETRLGGFTSRGDFIRVATGACMRISMAAKIP